MFFFLSALTGKVYSIHRETWAHDSSWRSPADIYWIGVGLARSVDDRIVVEFRNDTNNRWRTVPAM